MRRWRKGKIRLSIVCPAFEKILLGNTALCIYLYIHLEVVHKQRASNLSNINLSCYRLKSEVCSANYSRRKALACGQGRGFCTSGYIVQTSVYIYST